MMGGFFEWFLIVLGIAAVFNAEKLPALRVLLEEKLKDSLDAAKTGAQTAKAKMEEVKKDIDAKKMLRQKLPSRKKILRKKRRKH